MIDWSKLKTKEATVQDARTAKWEQIKAERDRRKYGGARVGTHWFHSDDPSRVQWLGLKDMARDILDAGGTAAEPIRLLGQPVVWKTLAGDFVPVTVQLAFDVNEATKNLDAHAFAVAEQHRMAMEAGADPDNYDFSAGWPTQP